MLLDVPVSDESTNILGKLIYYAILITGVTSFVAGSFGSVGMFVKRMADRDLRAYASPINYFNYLFLLAVFVSGLCAWYFTDPTFAGYREFWKGLITFNFKNMELMSAIHIILFSLLLIYLPFTRSMHYITRFFAFLWVNWDDDPNLKGSEIEKNAQKWLNQCVSWSAPHIQPGEKWKDLALETTPPKPIEVRQ
jgi:nitrate reductase gamma subunit